MTKRVTLQWQGERHFVATDDTGNQVGINGPHPEGSRGMGASHLLLSALGGCVGTTVIGVLEKKRQQVTAFEIEIVGEHLPDWPKTFTGIHLIYKITGIDVSMKAAERAVELAETRYCTVSASLAPPITREIQIIPAAEGVAEPAG
ncbi:MAG: OsmC family peroxiredoxin [Caldilineae bacterium]|nr:MAG: OsmC family peroxiredoxin [Caldilineae bacterium]